MLLNLKHQKYEPFIFLLLLIIHLFPIISLSPFVTLDGPAHLYNARLIHDLFLNIDEQAFHFFRFNTFPEPNWTGHFLSAISVHFFSPIITEKLLLIFTVLLYAFGFRYLIETIAPKQIFSSYLIFPWIYNFPFLLGFFNYSIAIGIWFFILAYWIKNQNQISSNKLLKLIVLLLVLYFSHLVLLCICILSMITITSFSSTKDELKSKLVSLLKITLPFIVLILLFLMMKGFDGYRADNARLPFMDLINHYTKCQPLIIYNGGDESIFGIIYSLAISIILIYSFLNRSINKYQKSISILLIALIVLHWICPDSLASGGIMSIRIAQLIFLTTL